MDFKNHLLEEAKERTKRLNKSASLYIDDFSSELLKEAENKIFITKFASLLKEAMAYLAGQEDLNGVPNVLVKQLPDRPKVEKIKQDIETAFAPFMKDQTGALNSTFSPTGQPIPRATKKTPLQLGQAINGNLSPDPDLANNGMRNGSQGCTYFRWAYARTILPTEKKSANNAKQIFDELNKFVDQSHTFDEFQKWVENNYIPLAPHCLTSDSEGLSSKSITDFIYQFGQNNDIPEHVLQKIRSTQKQIEERRSQIQQLVLNRKIKRGEPLSVGKRNKHLTFGLEEVSKINNHSELIRLIAFKIASGYGLKASKDDNALIDAMIENAREQVQQMRTAGKEVTPDFQKKILHLLQTQYPKIIGVYNKILSHVKQNREMYDGFISGKMKSKDNDEEDEKTFYTKKSNPNGDTSLDYCGIPMTAKYKSGKINPKAYRLDYGTGAFIGSDQLKLLLKSLYTPMSNQILTEPDSYVDPIHPMSFDADGISDCSINALEGQKSIGLPPLDMAIYCPHCGHRNRISRYKNAFKHQPVPLPQLSPTGDITQSEEVLALPCLKCRVPFRHKSTLKDENDPYAQEYLKSLKMGVTLDEKSVNMGGAHLVKSGQGIESLLINYGKWAKNTWDNLIKATQQNQLSQNLMKLMSTFNNGFWGSDAFEYTVNNMNSTQFYEFVDSNKQGSEDKANSKSLSTVFGAGKDPNQKEYLFKLMKFYGPYLSKLMDFSHLISRYCCPTVAQTNTGQHITTYNFGSGSGVGGGGEILLSVKYAYKATVEDFVSSQSEFKTYKQELTKEKLPVTTPVLNRVQDANLKQDQTKNDLVSNPTTHDTGPSIGLNWIGTMTFFLGMSSSQPGKQRTGRFVEILQSDNWQEIAARFQELYPMIVEADGTFVPSLNFNIHNLQKNVKSAMHEAAAKINFQEIIKYKDNVDNIEEVITEKAAPITDTSEEMTSTQSVLPQNTEQNKPSTEIAPITPIQQSQDSVSDINTQAPVVDEKIVKNTPKRKLMVKRPDPNAGKISQSELINNLIKVANKLDAQKEYLLSNKIDYFIRNIIK